MFNRPKTQVEKRLKNLEQHLAHENPVILRAVQSFRELDRVAQRLGLFGLEESYALRVSWWPMVAVLGTFSAGKSTFINGFLGQKVQLTGNQAVDDKFTVLSYSRDQTVRALPGLALDADPRFPFYKISEEIEKVAAGQGRATDAYIQLKTCPSEPLRGKILIDSPGFDADAQRTATLRFTDHIINLADLVLVFFDARKPEPGAMHDTLEHLVTPHIGRVDSEKFLYILNQMDTTAKDNNSEDVVAAWQRALAQAGLTVGRFYQTYNREVAIPIEDERIRFHLEAKRDQDISEIYNRIQQLEVERSYRIIGVLEKTARDIEGRCIPVLSRLLGNWRKRVLWIDAIVFGMIAAVLVPWTFAAGHWEGLRYQGPEWLNASGANPALMTLVIAAALAASGLVHIIVRKLARKQVVAGLRREMGEGEPVFQLIRAFEKSTRPLRSIFKHRPSGWSPGMQGKVAKVLYDADHYIQDLNDKFTDPSGKQNRRAPLAQVAQYLAGAQHPAGTQHPAASGVSG
jgi:Predicted GTPases